jgi:ribulose-5-phosphate 4-epimerase/fuculose-1-phosphate aldolase
MKTNDIKHNLAFAYQLLADLKMDDLTYTHLSARSEGSDQYYIFPFGLLFSEVTPENLLTVTLEGEVLNADKSHYNNTGYVIHSNIYRARPDVNAIFHAHTTAGIAVSAMECGLLPLSQFSLHFYNRMAYHRYDSLALDYHQQGEKLVNDLGFHNTLFLRNHGTLTCGASIHEAFFNLYYLEQACKVQCMAMSTNTKLLLPSPEVCEKAAHDLRSYEPDLGARDWQALKRTYTRKNSNQPVMA